MHITQRTIDDIVVLTLEGRLIADGPTELLRDTMARVVAQGHPKVLLNLSGVPHIDSGGLGELVRCLLVAQRAHGTVKLIGITGRVVNLLTITKLITVFDTFETEQEALASLMATA
jgi:anti-sigma B factor antagonist